MKGIYHNFGYLDSLGFFGWSSRLQRIDLDDQRIGIRTSLQMGVDKKDQDAQVLSRLKHKYHNDAKHQLNHKGLSDDLIEAPGKLGKGKKRITIQERKTRIQEFERKMERKNHSNLQESRLKLTQQSKQGQIKVIDGCL